MQKKINKIALGFFVLVFGFLFFNLVHASSERIFGGTKILQVESQKIIIVEGEGYSCNLMGGTTFDIKPLLGPVSYFIPAGTKPKTGTMPKAGNKQIIGKYRGTTTINCEKKVTKSLPTPYGGMIQMTQTLKKDVILPTVTYFGTSKR